MRRREGRELRKRERKEKKRREGKNGERKGRKVKERERIQVTIQLTFSRMACRGSTINFLGQEIEFTAGG